MNIKFLQQTSIGGEIFPQGQTADVNHDDAVDLISRGVAEYTSAGVVTSAAWDDLRFPVSGINPAGAASPPTVDSTTFAGSLLFAHNAENVVAGIAQMPHSWLRGSDISPHVHWSKTTSATGGVVWEWAYAVADIGGTFGAYSDWAAGVDAVPDGDTANKHALAAFPDIDMSDYKESVCIAWKVRRNPDATADNYAADARLWEFDIHYQVAKLGTVNEIPS